MGSIEQPMFDAGAALVEYGVDVGSLHGISVVINSAQNEALARLYPKQVIAEGSENEAWRNQFWSLHQREAKPTAIFQPSSAREVAIALLLCRLKESKFAVKSGGHAAMKGASSVDDGIVIDMVNLDQITYNTDKSIVSLGTGNRWTKVYNSLDKDGLSVAGGRAGDVGVGGYTLGGGISFFASARGWGCDNVRNFELVTASGEILNVNYHSYPDLYWALRGGGSNLAIVTRFDYETFPQGNLFAGSLIYEYEHKQAAIKAFATYARDADPKSATWLTIAYAQGKKLMSALAMYADSKPDAAALQPYLSIPSLHNSAKVRSMADMAQEIADVQVQEHRQNYWNHTFKFDIEFVAWLTDMYWSEIVKVADAYEGKQGLVMVMQIYTKESVALMQREGGNCLGLTEYEAPYLNVMLPSAWLHEKEDEVVFDIVRKIHGLAVDEGKKRGLYREFIYMNYASVYQDALRGYGKENFDRLKAVAGKYDPDSVFQTLMPGYFRFSGAPLV